MPYHDKDIMKQEKCTRCKYEWLPRTPDPRACPNCKSRKWKLKKEEKGDAF